MIIDTHKEFSLFIDGVVGKDRKAKKHYITLATITNEEFYKIDNINDYLTRKVIELGIKVKVFHKMLVRVYDVSIKNENGYVVKSYSNMMDAPIIMRFEENVRTISPELAKAVQWEQGRVPPVDLERLVSKGGKETKMIKERITKKHDGYYNVDRVDRILDTYNRLSRNFGVESVRNSDVWSAYYCDILYLYSNTGDTYSPTLVYDVFYGRFYLASIGDIIENAPKRFRDKFLQRYRGVGDVWTLPHCGDYEVEVLWTEATVDSEPFMSNRCRRWNRQGRVYEPIN